MRLAPILLPIARRLDKSNSTGFRFIRSVESIRLPNPLKLLIPISTKDHKPETVDLVYYPWSHTSSCYETTDTSLAYLFITHLWRLLTVNVYPWTMTTWELTRVSDYTSTQFTSVIFVNENENENGEKRENNEFVNEN